MYKTHHAGWNYMHRFHPKPNQTFEAKVFKPVRPILHKSRTLPDAIDTNLSFLTPIATGISPKSIIGLDEEDEEEDTTFLERVHRIEGHFCDSEGKKYIELSWKQEEISGEEEPQTTTFPIEEFPTEGHKLLIEYLVSKVSFKQEEAPAKTD